MTKTQNDVSESLSAGDVERCLGGDVRFRTNSIEMKRTLEEGEEIQ